MKENEDIVLPDDYEEVVAKLGPSYRFNGYDLTNKQKLERYKLSKDMFE